MSVLNMAKPAMKTVIDWDTWKSRWVEATDLPTRLGLLYSCPSTPVNSEEEEADKICLLMAVAHYPVHTDPAWHECAKKAFAILHKGVFSGVSGFIEFRDRQAPYIHPKILAAFFEFFTPNPKVESNRPMIVQPFMHKDLEYFINRVCGCVWEGERDIFVPYKPSVVEIMHGRGSLHRLYGKWDRFDEPSLAKLEEIALRDADSLEEGVEGCSRAAQALLIVKTSIAEMERRNKKALLEESIEQGKRELAQL